MTLYFWFYRCLGSTQHLKNKYGSGYFLELQLPPCETQENINSIVIDKFPNATLTEQFGLRISYKVPNDNVQSLSKTFANLAQCKFSSDTVNITSIV